MFFAYCKALAVGLATCGGQTEKGHDTRNLLKRFRCAVPLIVGYCCYLLFCVLSLEQLGRIDALVDEALNLGYHAGTVGGIGHAKPLAGSVEHLYSGGLVVDELVDH